MLQDILVIIWIFTPMGVANMGPVIANNVPLLRRFTTPLDMGRTFRGKRVFGDHKTFRGVIAATAIAALAGVFQLLVGTFLIDFDTSTFPFDYTESYVILVAAAIGLGSIIGDAVKSFFKRQLSIDPGKSWVPFDQLDFVAGGLVASLFFFRLPLHMYIIGIVIALILHPTINIIAWLLRLQDKPF